MFEKNDKETILAQGCSLTMDTWKSHINNNVVVVGSSGRGKTRNFIKPNIMQMNSNYIISDPKGTLIKELGTMLKNNGYKIKLLNLIDMKHSNTYNPFHYLKSERDIYKMLDFLIANTDPITVSHADPFWEKSEKALIGAICFYLMEECNPDDQNFESVMKLLRCINASEYAEDRDSVLDVLMKDLREKNPDSLAVKQYEIFKSVGGGKTAQSILISCQVRLQYFNLSEYINLTSSDNLELEKLSEEKTALFVIISDTDRSLNWLAGLFYSQLFDILCWQENKCHIRFILDDFVCTGKIPDFDYKIAMIRSRNISCMIVIQDEAQLEKEYGKAARTIITNCENYVFLGASNVEACADVAKRICKFGVKAEDIIDLPYEKCVVISGNKRGIYRKYDIKKHPRYSQIADAKDSPLYYEYKKDFNTQRVYCLFTGDDRVPSRYRRKLNKDVIEINKRDSVVKKSGLFDSPEEEYLYDILKGITNIIVSPHQHLIDLFQSPEKEISKKLSYMHCDFVLYDNQMKVLFGIEIDGSQHLTDIVQMKNDQFKNDIFEQNGISLLRFSAWEVRNNASDVVADIMDAIKNADSKIEHILATQIEKFLYENYQTKQEFIDSKVIPTVYVQKIYSRMKEEETYKRNHNIHVQETAMKKIDKDAGSPEDVIIKNDLTVSVEQLEQKFSEKYNLDNISSLPQEFDIENDLFYTEQNIEHLEKIASDIENGNVLLMEHELIEDNE